MVSVNGMKVRESNQAHRNLAGLPTWTPLIARSPTCSEGDFMETMLQELITSTRASTGRRSGNYSNIGKISYHHCLITLNFDKLNIAIIDEVLPKMLSGDQLTQWRSCT